MTNQSFLGLNAKYYKKPKGNLSFGKDHKKFGMVGYSNLSEDPIGFLRFRIIKEPHKAGLCFDWKRCGNTDSNETVRYWKFYSSDTFVEDKVWNVIKLIIKLEFDAPNAWTESKLYKAIDLKNKCIIMPDNKEEREKIAALLKEMETLYLTVTSSGNNKLEKAIRRIFYQTFA